MEASRSFNLSLKDSQGLSKIEKVLPNDSQSNFHQRGSSHQNVIDPRTDQKIIAESQNK